MSERALDRLMAQASPIDDDAVAALDLTRAESELLEAIVSSAPEAVPNIAAARERRARRRAPRRLIGMGVAAAAIVGFVLLVGGGGARHELAGPAYAGAAVRVAKANSRILVGLPGWKVTRADEFTVDNGEMTFSDGKHELGVFWKPASQYRGYMRDRGADGAARVSVTVLGRRGTRFLSRGLQHPDFRTLLPPQGRNFIEISGELDERTYMGLLRSLTTVDIDRWLAALPVGTVRPADRAAAVDEILKGIPIPPGLDVARLRRGDAVKDRYSLGFEVSGAVACGWLDQWNTARRTGDAAAKTEAVRAMQTSHHWPVLLQPPLGNVASIVWEYADQIAMGTPGYSGHAVDVKPGNDVHFRRNYVSALGCP